MPKNYYTFIWGPKILRKSTVMGWWGGRSRFDTLKPLITSDLINLRPMFGAKITKVELGQVHFFYDIVVYTPKDTEL